MATIFTKIIQGEIPASFVWRDDRCVVFLSISPLGRGHALVVPIDEVDHWIDAAPELNAHLFEVARIVGQAQMAVFDCERIGLIVAGYEVPHLHVHVIPTSSIREFDFARERPAEPSELEAAAAELRAELRSMGCPEVV